MKPRDGPTFFRVTLLFVPIGKVTKKSFTEVASLLDQAERPTRLTFVRHACGRRFVGRDQGYGGVGTCRGAARQQPPWRVAHGGGWDGCCGMMGKSGCGGKQPPNASCVGRLASSPSPKIEVRARVPFRNREVDRGGPAPQVARLGRQGSSAWNYHRMQSFTAKIGSRHWKRSQIRQQFLPHLALFLKKKRQSTKYRRTFACRLHIEERKQTPNMCRFAVIHPGFPVGHPSPYCRPKRTGVQWR